MIYYCQISRQYLKDLCRFNVGHARHSQFLYISIMTYLIYSKKIVKVKRSKLRACPRVKTVLSRNSFHSLATSLITSFKKLPQPHRVTDSKPLTRTRSHHRRHES